MRSTERLRNRLAWGIRTVLSGSPTRKFAPTPGAPTLLPAGGAAWLVHAEASMMVGGIRALLLQSLHPVAMQGVGEHSDFRNDPLGRLRRTVFFLGTTTYCSLRQAEQALEAVRRIHRGVSGTTPDGRQYRAEDPDLLTWVHVTEVDSFLTAFLRYGRRPPRGQESLTPNLPADTPTALATPDSDAATTDTTSDAAATSDGDGATADSVAASDGDGATADSVAAGDGRTVATNAGETVAARNGDAAAADGGMLLAELPDRYVAEMATIAERLGVADPPRSHAELEATIDGFRPVVAATDLSREAVYFLRRFPLPAPARLAYLLLFRAAVDSLPTWAQQLHGLRCGPLRARLVRPAVRLMLGAMGWALRDAPDPDPDPATTP